MIVLNHHLKGLSNSKVSFFSQFDTLFGSPVIVFERCTSSLFTIAFSMGLMHNYVIQCMRVRLGGIAKQVPPFFRECVFHFYILATNIPL